MNAAMPAATVPPAVLVDAKAEAEAAMRIVVIRDSINTALIELDAANVAMGDSSTAYWKDCCPECAMQLVIARDSINVAVAALRNLA